MDLPTEQITLIKEYPLETSLSTHARILSELALHYFPGIYAGAMPSEMVVATDSYSLLIAAVNNRYLDDPSTIRENPTLFESFRIHNSEVLETTSFYAHLFDLSDNQKKIVATAAILHDIAKSDPAPDNIPENLRSDYTLLMHPEVGANLVQILMSAHPEWETEHIDDIIEAIRCHSGPMPGFLAERLSFYNAQATVQIELTEIDPGHTPSIILLAADMMALGSPTGVRKIVQLREQSPYFTAQDEGERVRDNRGSIHEVRIDSALRSAYSGAEMVRSLMTQHPQLKNFAEQNFSLMTHYFKQTKSELLAS